MLTIEKIRAFLSERPLLTARGLCLEAGIAEASLGKILRNEPGRNLTKRLANKLLPVFLKYGLKNNE